MTQRKHDFADQAAALNTLRAKLLNVSIGTLAQRDEINGLRDVLEAIAQWDDTQGDQSSGLTPELRGRVDRALLR